jgi:ribosomal protein L3 glutamine methyltransferase
MPLPSLPPSVADLIRDGASQLMRAGLCIGHHADNALDEARALVQHALHLPGELPASLGGARVLPREAQRVRALIQRRINERIPAAYLIGRARFAGIDLLTDSRALVPRSPIAELIEAGFEPWLAGRHVHHALDLCTGGGSIAVAMAVHRPNWQIDGADLSPAALSLAAENVQLHRVGQRLSLFCSDLFAALHGNRYQLIVSNPPYLSDTEFRSLPPEYAHEPAMALPSGTDGLDLTLRMLHEAPDYLDHNGLLIVEIGESERHLRALLPEVEFQWIEFSVGPMGVFAVEAAELRTHAKRIGTLWAQRAGVHKAE